MEKIYCKEDECLFKPYYQIETSGTIYLIVKCSNCGNLAYLDILDSADFLSLNEF